MKTSLKGLLSIGISSLLFVSFMFFGFIASAGAAETGSLARGKELFEWKAPNGKSCVGCHANGKLLETTANKKVWVLMGVKFKKMEDVVNLCRENPMGLHSPKFAPGSKDMEAIKEYIFSFTKK